eukprot:gene39454-52008_t
MSFEDSFSLIDDQELMSGEGDLLGEEKNKDSWSEDEAAAEDSNIGGAIDAHTKVPTEDNNMDEKDQDDSDEDGDAEGEGEAENREQDDGDNENGDSQQQLLSADGPDSSSKKKEQRSNAKSVECFDLSGNLLYVFKSGMIASQTLNISQGDISQCCRGIKRSHMGYKFRFFGDAADRKKGTWKEGDSNQRADLMRSTRQANRWSGAAE